MASKIEIVNIAMVLIGEDTIISLTSNLGEKERKVNAVFDTTRDEVLRAFNWSFATKEATLAQLSATPLYGYDYKYQLPSDFIRLIEVEDDVGYRILGKCLYTNETSINIRYTARITDTTFWDNSFINAFSAKLAMKLAYPLTNSNTLQASLKQYYDEAIKEAKGISSQENGSDEMYNDILTEARYSA